MSVKLIFQVYSKDQLSPESVARIVSFLEGISPTPSVTTDTGDGPDLTWFTAEFPHEPTFGEVDPAANSIQNMDGVIDVKVGTP